jgi:hypothetical protein
MGNSVDRQESIVYKILGFFEPERWVHMVAVLSDPEELRPVPYELDEDFVEDIDEMWNDGEWNEIATRAIEEVERVMAPEDFSHFDEERAHRKILDIIHESSNLRLFVERFTRWVASTLRGVSAEEEAEDAEELDSRPVSDEDDYEED